MDSETLIDIFDKISLMKTSFCGIIEFKNIKRLKNTKWDTLDFIVLNSNGHWLTLIWMNSDTIMLFDTLSGEMTYCKSRMKKILLNTFSGVRRVIFQYGEDRIQKNGTLICGEHVLYFLMFQTIFFLERGYFDLNYVSRLVNFCNQNGLDTDEFVWNEIYVKLKLTKPPDLMQVLHWYENW